MTEGTATHGDAVYVGTALALAGDPWRLAYCILGRQVAAKRAGLPTPELRGAPAAHRDDQHGGVLVSVIGLMCVVLGVFMA